MIGTVLGALFGGGRNVVTDVVETFRPNAERSAQRRADSQAAALDQFAAEFRQRPEGRFGRFVNALNRLPRPLMALGTIGFFAYNFIDPVGFSVRMQPLALVPAELWWLFGGVVTFYFGARELQKGRERTKPEDVARVVSSMKAISALRADPAAKDPKAPAPDGTTGNAAVDGWLAKR